MEPKPIFLNAPADLTPEEGRDARRLGAKKLPDNPFVGLKPFESEQSMLFHGRGRQIGELLEFLYSQRFVAVVGSSGCGKSSLIRAGLIPNLEAGFLIQQRDRWAIAKMKPGDAPLRNLAASLLAAFRKKPAPGEEAAARAATEGEAAALCDALRLRGVTAAIELLRVRMLGGDRKPKINLLLLVDQFEEIFRFGAYGDDEDEAASEDETAAREGRRSEAADFVSIMLELSRQPSLPVYVVMTMRSDFLSDCDAFYGLPEAMNESQYLVPRLTRGQRQEAIQKPVELYDQKMTSRLIDRVLNDMGDEADQLPVMQHALMRTWEKWAERHEGPIDLVHYEHPEVGGIRNALALDAERAIAGKTPEGAMTTRQKTITKRMFQALTQTDAKERRLRRPARLSEIAAIVEAAPAEVEEVVERFREDNRSFLVPSEPAPDGDRLIDISHESLIRRWDKLRRWVDMESRSRDHYLRLASDAERHERGEADLLTGVSLQGAQKWWAERQPNEPWARRYHKRITPVEKFLEKSKQDFARTEQFLRDSAEAAALTAAQEEEERQLELKRVRQLARRNMMTTVVFLAMTILLTVLLALTILAQKAAESERIKADAERSNANKSAETAEEERKTAKGSEFVAYVNQLTAEVSANDANAARDELEKERDKLRETNAELGRKVKELETEKRLGVTLARRGLGNTLYADGLEAEASAPQMAHDYYVGAVENFDLLSETNDKIRGARVSAKLGSLMFKDSYAAAVSGDAGPPAASNTPPAKVDAAFLTTGVPRIVKAAFGEVEPSPADFSAIELDRYKMEAVKHYGKAVATYGAYVEAEAQLRDGRAKLLNDLGDSFDQGSNTNYDDPDDFEFPESVKLREEAKSSPTTPAEVAKTQVAINLFCAAADDLKLLSDRMDAGNYVVPRTSHHERRISLLLKIGYRLYSPPPADGETGQQLKLQGCPGGRPEAADYFVSALDLYRELIFSEDGNPEKAAERRKAAEKTAVDVAKKYFSEKDTTRAKTFFSLAVGFYRENDPAQRLELAQLRNVIADTYISAPEDGSNLAAAGFELEEAAKLLEGVDASDTRSEVADALSTSVLQLGEALLKANDPGSAGKTFEIISLIYPPDDPSQWEKLSTALVRVGEKYLKDKQAQAPEEGYKNLARAIKIYGEPSNTEQRKAMSGTLIGVGSVLLEIKQDGAALEHFNRAADLFVKVDDFENAGSTFNDIGLLLPPEEGLSSRYYLQAANAFGRDGQREDQVQSLLLSSGSLNGLLNEGALTPELRTQLENNYAEVRRILVAEPLPNVKPEVTAKKFIVVSRGYVGLKEFDKAISTYNEAFDTKTTDDRVLGDIYFGIGDAEKARAAATGQDAAIARARAAYAQARAKYEAAKSAYLVEKVDDAVKELGRPMPTPTPTPTPTPQGTQAAVEAVTLKAKLGGASSDGDGPKGKAHFEIEEDEGRIERRLVVEVEKTGLLADTPLDVFVDGVKVGVIQVSRDRKRSTLTLSSGGEGETFPQVNAYSRVSVTDPSSGKTIVSGSFQQSGGQTQQQLQQRQLQQQQLQQQKQQ
jgi:hypothetical protein